MAKHIEFASPLAAAECVRRLVAVTDRERFPESMYLRGTRPVGMAIGRAYIVLRKRHWYRNSFQTRLFLRFQESTDGTWVVGRFGMGFFPRLLLIALCAGTIAASLFFFVVFLAAAASGIKAIWVWGGLIASLAVTAACIWLVRMMRRGPTDDVAFLTSFTLDVLGGRENRWDRSFG